MKKITILSILFAGLAFAACKKERTCECTETRSNNAPNSTAVTDPVVVTQIKDIKGGEAKSWCQNSEEVVTTGTYVATTKNDCKLKK